ncbi:MAG: hypothetical protein HYX75_00170 [Acidobacteria bacterium]|nr:hypothetical protein [Acidobacteriota bacterium]
MEFQKSIRKKLIRAAFMSNTSWAIIGGSLALSVGLQDPFILLLGAAAETVAVMLLLSSKKFVRRVFGQVEAEQEQKKRTRLDSMIKQSDPETRERYVEIMRCAQEIEQLTQESDSAFLTTGLAPIVSQLEMLQEKSASLMEKRLLIRKYLSNADTASLEKECQKLERHVSLIQDPIAKRQFQQSLTLKKQELETYRSMFIALQRIDGQLEQISSTLSSLKGKIILLKTSEVTTEGGYEQMGEELKGLIGDVELMENSVADAAALGVTRRPQQKVLH